MNWKALVFTPGGSLFQDCTSTERGEMFLMYECLEVKKVRPVKTMWLSLIPTSQNKATERTTSVNRLT